MLLLSWPKLTGKKNLWLQAWFLTSYFHGLYYPVFGAAVAIGFIPLGIWIVYTYIKSGEFGKDIKTVRFWVSWVICFIPVIFGIGLLKGTALHIKALGDQTIYSDGIARFGQFFPEGFLPLINNIPIRLVVYYLLSFWVIICIVWAFAAISFKNIILIKDPEAGFVSASCGIMMLVAFSYTLVRYDFQNILARNKGLVYAAFVMLILIAERYSRSGLEKKAVFIFAVSIIAVFNLEAFHQIEYCDKFESAYTVPDNYTYVDDNRLGIGFIDKELYDSINRSRDYAETLDSDRSYLGNFELFGYYYLNRIKGCSTIEPQYTVKGYDAVNETIDYIRRNHALVGTYIDSVANYYLFHYLLTSGEYLWSPEKHLFISNDSGLDRDAVNHINSTSPLSGEHKDIGRIGCSWGESMEFMNKVFVDPDIEATVVKHDDSLVVNLDREVNGDQADFIYIELSDIPDKCDYILFEPENEYIQETETMWYGKDLMKEDHNRDYKVLVSWSDDEGNAHDMSASLWKGRLLIPIGAGKGWLFNRHSEIGISIIDENSEVSVPDIKEIKFLKAREPGIN